MTKRRLQVWLPLLFSLVMVLGMVVGYKIKQDTSMPGFFTIASKSTLQEVIDLIRLRYVDDVKTDTLGTSAIPDVLHALDPHSVYISPADLAQVNDELRGNFSGIGVEFQMFHDTVHVVSVIKDGPSDDAGLMTGDRLIMVNDSIRISGAGRAADEIRKFLRGERGTTVKVTIMRAGKLLPVKIKRGTIPLPSVDAAYMLDDSTGFIHLNKFAESTYREFMRALEKLKTKNLQRLIVDLRGNGGGLLSQAVNIADEFLDEDKMIVYTQGSHVPRYEYNAQKEGLFEKGKLAILVDETSASASEVLAGALQDWDRATIVGRRTFGKGLVQEQFSLSNGGALRLTVARYYTPLGRNIQKSYANGYKAYEQEVSNRMHDGEVMTPDTSQNRGKAYKTPLGRLVFGGGGITPDVFVPMDTTSLSRDLLRLYRKGILQNFIYTFYVQHKNELSAYQNPSALGAGFKAGDDVWKELRNFAARDSVFLEKLSPADKQFLQDRIPGMLARQIWRYQGFYEVANRTDEFVLKALESFQ